MRDESLSTHCRICNLGQGLCLQGLTNSICSRICHLRWVYPPCLFWCHTESDVSFAFLTFFQVPCDEHGISIIGFSERHYWLLQFYLQPGHTTFSVTRLSRAFDSCQGAFVSRLSWHLFRLVTHIRFLWTLGTTCPDSATISGHFRFSSQEGIELVSVGFVASK